MLRDFINKIYDNTYSDEVYDYLLDIITNYNLEPYFNDFPNDVIEEVLKSLYYSFTLLEEFELFEKIYITESKIKYDFRINLTDYSEKYRIEINRELEEFKMVIDNLNNLLKIFG